MSIEVFLGDKIMGNDCVLIKLEEEDKYIEVEISNIYPDPKEIVDKSIRIVINGNVYILDTPRSKGLNNKIIISGNYR
ncbi:MAG: hypothetical protein PHV06_00960 [bacterium]|nr:hypothetical protein [bacterium]